MGLMLMISGMLAVGSPVLGREFKSELYHPSLRAFGLTKQWKSGKLILHVKGYACISPDVSNELSWLPLWKIRPRGVSNVQNEDQKRKPREENIPVQVMAALKIFKKHCPRCHQPHDLPTWGQIKTLTNQAENLVSQQGMPWNPENIFVALLAFASPAQAELINHTYWAYWRRHWRPTPVLLLGKSHGWRSLVGCSPWGHTESDMTERLHFHFSLSFIGEGNGNPLVFLHGGACWAAVYGVTQSRT